MPFELGAYLAALLVTFVYALTGSRGRWYGAPVAAAVIGYLVAARYSPFDADMITYAQTLERPVVAMLVSTYYLREWAYWITSGLIYQLTNSAQLTFLIFDFLALLALMRARKHLGLPHYFVGLMFVLFSSVLGVQNIYRQFLASCFLLLAIVQPGKRRWLTFALAGFTQNAAFLFLPLMYAYQSPSRPRVREWLFAGSAIAVLVALPIAAGTKSSAATGADLRVVYLGVLFAVAYLITIIKRGVLRYDLALPLGYTFSLFLLSIFTLGQSQAERVGMLAIFMLVPFMCDIVGRQRELSPITRALLVVVLSAPALMFPSSLTFLLS